MSPSLFKLLFNPISVQVQSAIKSGTVILILITCLGLFGLATFVMNQRTKEIGVRKVLGASNTAIMMSFGKDFLKMTVIANAIAFPLALYYVRDFLNEYPYHIPVYWWLFLIPFAATVVITICTVSYAIIKASQPNPVTILKEE